MRADCDLPALSELFEQIFAASPWPMLMLGEDGSVVAASDEHGEATPARVPAADVLLRQRASHYVSLLTGRVPWLTPQQADSVRALPSGAPMHERIHLCRTPWGASITIVDHTALVMAARGQHAADIQTARLAALGFMVAGVCHEVTNPLTSLHSIVQILRSEKALGKELLDKGLDNIAVNVKRILDISRRLVNFSRVGDEPRMRFAVDDAIDEALSVLRQGGQLQGIDLHHVADPNATVFGNTGQVREVLLNLCVNAVQAMGGQGRLSISTRGAGRMLDVLVSDSGPGIPAETRVRIFEPFFTTKAATHGTGLGLAISNEIALEHGGSIELRQTSAQGSTFCLTLPRERP